MVNCNIQSKANLRLYSFGEDPSLSIFMNVGWTRAFIVLLVPTMSPSIEIKGIQEAIQWRPLQA